jgi:hypothetical protein
MADDVPNAATPVGPDGGAAEGGRSPRGPRKKRTTPQPQQQPAGDSLGAAPSKRASSKPTPLPGFTLPPGIERWNVPFAQAKLADYLATHRLGLEVDQSPTGEEWTAFTKPAITCLHCGVTTTTTCIASLQKGHGISCVCSGRASLQERWYYERAIAQPFEDRDGRVWYPRLHDGTLAKPSWEEWLAAAEHGKNGKLQLTCLHCGITSTTTCIASLQRGGGRTCKCATI